MKRAASYVLRDNGTSVVFWIAAVVGVVLLIDAVVRGGPLLFATTAPFVAAAVWLVWVTLFRPHVRYDLERVVVTNIGRVHDLPWTQVAAVRQRLNLSFDLVDGRTIGAIGVTAPRSRGLVLSGLSRGKLGAGSANFHEHTDAITPIREAAAPSTANTVSRWDSVPLLIGAVVAVAVVLDILALTI